MTAPFLPGDRVRIKPRVVGDPFSLSGAVGVVERHRLNTGTQFVVAVNGGRYGVPAADLELAEVVAPKCGCGRDHPVLFHGTPWPCALAMVVRGA